MKRTRYFVAGMLTGAVLFGGSVAYAAGVIAERSTNTIYIDGQRMELEAYSINGANYLKLRDVGKAVGFNVYWDGAVQINSTSPYTGEPPKAPSITDSEIRVVCYKGNTLATGDRSGLIISPQDITCTAVSSNSSVADVEQVVGFWVVIAKSPGTTQITVTAPDGRTGNVTVTVTAAPQASPVQPKEIDLSANLEIRQEMIRLINQTRKANGVGELAINDALMNAAQDCSAQGFTGHENQYECETGLSYGYPHGFGSNFTMFTFSETSGIAEQAVNNWINSPGHFQTMIAERYDCIGIGVTVDNGKATCFMCAGNPNGHNPYE